MDKALSLAMLEEVFQLPLGVFLAINSLQYYARLYCGVVLSQAIERAPGSLVQQRSRANEGRLLWSISNPARP